MVKHQARTDVAVGLGELKRHAGLLHNDRMRKPGLCYHSLPRWSIPTVPATCLCLASEILEGRIHLLSEKAYCQRD